MSAPQPETIGQRLFSQLESLLESDEAPNEFQLRRMESQADALMGANAGEGLTVKAAIAALRWNIEDVRKLAKRSTQIDPSVITLINSALTVKNAALVDEACDYMAKAYERAPKDPIIAERFINYLMHAGRVQEAAEIMREAQDTGVELPDDIIDAISFRDSLHELGIDPGRVHHELQCGYQVLKNNRKRPRTISYSQHHEPDGGRSVVISFGIYGDLEEEMRLESELAELLVADEEWNPCLLSVDFEVIREHGNQPA